MKTLFLNLLLASLMCVRINEALPTTSPSLPSSLNSLLSEEHEDQQTLLPGRMLEHDDSQQDDTDSTSISSITPDSIHHQSANGNSARRKTLDKNGRSIFPRDIMDTSVNNDTTTNGSQFNMTPAAIALITCGAVFLIVLVVLVFVLFACLCPKCSAKKPFNCISTDSSNSSSSNLVVSSSMEQNNTSGNSEPPHTITTPTPSHKHHASNPSINHTYVNAEVNHLGEFRPFTPLYVNGDDESMRELLPERGSHHSSRTREGRGWSVVSSRSQLERIHNNNNNLPQGSNRDQRAHSVSAGSRYKIDAPLPISRPRSLMNNLSTVLMDPLPLPPTSVPPPLHRIPHLVKSNSQLANLVPAPTHTPPPPITKAAPPPPPPDTSSTTDPNFFIEASGDYTAPVPVSERYKYNPKIRQNEMSMSAEMSVMHHQQHQQPVAVVNDYHDYSDPDEPSEQEIVDRYDHLTPAEVHPEEGVPCFEGLKDESISSSELIEGCINAEEQRRMIKLQHRGHYEMNSEIEKSLGIGYDQLTYFHESDIYWAPAATAEDLYTQLSEYKYREISRTEISILNNIGSGQFGTVQKAMWVTDASSAPVALKSVKGTTGQERVKLLQEAAIMGQFAHNNVVRLHGVVTVGQPVHVVLEYMQKGDLRSFLQKLHQKTSQPELHNVIPKLFVRFSKDIANGMNYLAKKCFVHRDLAARNILLNNDNTCKIGDFGMARDIESENDYYRSNGGIIPVKWTAPEALHYNKYSSSSDVWSYGMVLFEIWSLGEKPFSDLSNPIVIALVSSKHCQPPPPGCPRPVYHLMVECWNPDHSHRPTFDSIYNYLDSPEESLLQWHNRDMIKDKMAHCLGVALDEANNLYLDLQRTYQKPLL